MATTFLNGDLFEAAADQAIPRALAFGADCTGKMESGIAVAFKGRWPKLAQDFQTHCTNTKMEPGDVFLWRDGSTAVYALGLHRGEAKPKFSTFERAMRTMLARAEGDNVSSILLPRIGAGKNGLDWTRVKRLLIDLGKGSPFQLVVFEQFVRAKATN